MDGEGDGEGEGEGEGDGDGEGEGDGDGVGVPGEQVSPQVQPPAAFRSAWQWSGVHQDWPRRSQPHWGLAHTGQPAGPGEGEGDGDGEGAGAGEGEGDGEGDGDGDEGDGGVVVPIGPNLMLLNLTKLFG